MSRAAQRWVIPSNAPESEIARLVLPAAQLLAQDEVVAFPTETVYGLGGNALSDTAVQKIFAAKGRPGDNPLIVHVSDREMIPMVASKMTASALKLCAKFWPGPLTVLVPCNGGVSKYCTAGKLNVFILNG
jgi:L-threonylcarbamoyladenylate synthase